MEQLLYLYNPHWESDLQEKNYIDRPEVFNSVLSQLNNKQVIFVTGLRRIGKTTLMRMLINYLIREVCSADRVLYISLDNYMLKDVTLSEILETYRQIHKLKHDDFVYIFLDEVTYFDNYEIQIKNLYDLGFCKIFASSSNASFIKSRKPDLTGRSRFVEVTPLDFTEYLNFKNIDIRKSDNHLKSKYFEDFLQSGGIPEYILTNDVEYIQNLVDDIIYKDIVAQYNIKNPRLLQDFFLLLMERAGKQFSINKIASILKISTETARRYLGYFADTYLVYLVERYGKTNERLLSPKKVYSSDLGIRNFFTGYRDKGAFFENYVFLKIKKLKPYYLYENKTEIDFVTDRLLIEAKFKNAELSQKQQELFDAYESVDKIIVRDDDDIQRILEKYG